MTRKTWQRSTDRRPKIASCPLVLERLERRDQPSFITAPSYSVDEPALAVAAGRFNGDGLADLAVVGGGKLTILAGLPNGSFTPIVSYAQAGRDVIAADFTGDNVLDLAVAKSGPGTGYVYVLVGNGDGTFKPPASYAGISPGSLAAGDFDGDGDLDLAAANYDSWEHNGPVKIMINSGSGTFTSGATYSSGTGPEDIIAADFDEDGDLDLVVAGYIYTTYGLQQTNMRVLLGNGDGTFQIGATYGDDWPLALATGDFDLDGDLDLALANYELGVSNGEIGVSVWLGNGDGTFAFAQSYANPDSPRSIATGDLDGDGRLDLVTVSRFGANVSVLHGLGDGTFESAVGYGLAESSGNDVITGDLDNDGDLDLVGASGEAVTILRNNGSGNFQPAVANLLTNGALNVEAADFNADGTPDLAVSGGPGYPSNQVIVIPVQANGSFGAAVSYTVGTGPGGFVAADFNNDGFPDLATANGGANTISVLMNKGDGTFFPAKTFAAGQSPASIGAADFTGDGKLDIVVTNHTQSQTLRLLRGTGSGRFRAPQGFEAGPYPGVLTIADFESDGDADVAVVGCPIQCGDVRLVLGDGNGSFASPVSYPVDYNPSDIEAVDVNSDDILDLVVLANGNVYLFQGLVNGTFSINFIYNPGGSGLEVADFNRDGAVDLALTHHLAPLRLMIGNGNGTFQIPLSYTTGDLYTDAEAADFNGDDYPDLAMNRLYTEDVIVAINAADWPPLPIPPPRPHHGVHDTSTAAPEVIQRRATPALEVGQWRATAVVGGLDEPSVSRPESRLARSVRPHNRGVSLAAELFLAELTAVSFDP